MCGGQSEAVEGVHTRSSRGRCCSGVGSRVPPNDTSKAKSHRGRYGEVTIRNK